MNEAIVQEPDHQAGSSGHGGMSSMPRELIAKNRVFGIVRAAPHEVARVKVAHNDRNLSRLKPLFDLLVQKQTDVLQPDVARGVTLVASVPQQLLSRAFGDGNYRVCALHNSPFQCSEKSAFPFQLEWHFRDECEVDILARHGGFGSQKSSVPSHEFH